MLRRWINPRSNGTALLEGLGLLRRHWWMLLEMTRDDLTGRYRGQWFGSAWVIAHPLALTLLYLFLFGVVFSQRLGGTRELPLDYTAYILSGLIPWLTFQTSMSSSVVSITSNAALVKQFTFPIELLPVREVLAASVTFMVGAGATLLYIVVSQGVLVPMWALLPVVFVVQLAAMVGVALILSAVAVFFRDIKDFVSLFSLAALFTMPIVYLPGWVPELFRPILWLNPFSYMTWVYQDVIYFGRFEHPWAWVIFVVWAGAAFVLGVRLFRSTKPMFASVM